MKRFCIWIFAISISMIGCGDQPEQVGTTMTIRNGYYHVEGNNEHYLKFQHDGSGEDLSLFQNPPDSLKYLFKWYIGEWSDGSETLVQDFGDYNSVSVIKFISDTGFYLCSNVDGRWCDANSITNSSFWDHYLKVPHP